MRGFGMRHGQGFRLDPRLTPEPLQIPEGTRIPSLSIHEVQHLLLNQKRSSSGPDNLSYWFWKSFSIELAPIVTEIFNMSLKTSKVPKKWKSANLLCRYQRLSRGSTPGPPRGFVKTALTKGH
jgi:hypothetical protein